MMTPTRAAGVALLTAIAIVTIAAPAIAPYDPGRQFSEYPFAPPMRLHIVDDRGAWHAPFVYPLVLVDRLERRYDEDRTRPQTLRWFAGGSLVSAPPGRPPWFPLGTDGLGRDVFSRVLLGSRWSLGVAVASASLALLLGALIGASAGFARGWVDELLMRTADLVIVVPGIYAVLALRGAMPLVLSNGNVFAAIVMVLGLVGWPSAARGVRGIVAAEQGQEYAEAARAVGASRARVLLRHLLPAARGFLVVQASVLVPAFVVAEATLSFVGLGFASPTPSWGAMLQDAQGLRTPSESPWLLAPAVAIVLTMLAVHLAFAARDPLLWESD